MMTSASKTTQSGNILLIILLAIVLIGALTVAIQGMGKHNATIDNEKLTIKITEVQRYASELERGVNFVLNNGKSEADIRFAHPNANADYGDLAADTDQRDQVFSKDGGSAAYRLPPAGVNDGSAWEFYGSTHLPEVGTDSPELIAVLPNVTEGFCKAINRSIGYDTKEQPADSGGCINSGQSERFGEAALFAATAGGVNEASFSYKPSRQGCVRCADQSYHYFHVLLAR